MKTNPEIKIDIPKSINKIDLADLCNITEQAIKAGGGFGWLDVPPRDILKKYWKGSVLVPHRKLIVGRLNGVIAGSLQLVFSPANNEAQHKITSIASHFVAPWARGFGLAKAMIHVAEKIALEFGANCIQLDIRETQEAAIKLFKSKGYLRWGVNPFYAFVEGKNLRGYYFYKIIK
jgi:ribosomal protein S18 acetylase RimI-like enzyme